MRGRIAAALAEELVDGLDVAGFRAFLDRQDIAAAEDWEARLGALILGADTVSRPAILATRSERMLCIIKSIILPSIICLNFPAPASTKRPGREIPI
jgi:hypothetical protein